VTLRRAEKLIQGYILIGALHIKACREMLLLRPCYIWIVVLQLFDYM
jgi:hypothetical protein